VANMSNTTKPSTVSLRDSYYRNLCDFPQSYDRTIDWIAANNPYASTQESINYHGSAESFAVCAVHSCINGALFSDLGDHCSSGMCFAARASSNPTLSGYNKVTLAIRVNGFARFVQFGPRSEIFDR